jgi:hypothetical protein
MQAEDFKHTQFLVVDMPVESAGGQEQQVAPSTVTSSVTSQKFLKYALKSVDDDKAVYEVVSIRTEIITHVRYVTVTEQPPPPPPPSVSSSTSEVHSSSSPGPASSSVDSSFDSPSLGAPSGAHALTFFDCDGHQYPHTLCLPLNPDQT